ncbi:MAG: hypothetical protein JWM40_1222 [Frankiales bacterium]|nr:hypothetical protein [Frankiales bacterium]
MLDHLRTRIDADEEGFTLIELLIVIVILGVLAGIVVFAIGGINDSSKTSACKSDLKTVETATEAFYATASPHAYPGSIGAMVPGFLKEAPSSTDYAIVLAAGGVVSATHGATNIAGCP